MSFPTSFAAPTPMDALSQAALVGQQAQIGKTTAGHTVIEMKSSTNETTAKTDKVAAETREEMVKNQCTCNVDCCCCHGWVSGLPATIICTVLCFWNPIAWCCLVPAWKQECCG